MSTSIVNHRVNKLTNRQGNNVNQVSMDCLPLRKGVCKEFAYHNVNSVSRHSKRRRLLDVYDNAKLMSSMASRRRKRVYNQVCQQWYQVIVNNGEYVCKVKSSHLLSKCQELVNKGVNIEVKPM